MSILPKGRIAAARLAVSLIFAVNGFLYASLTSRLPRLQEMYAIDNGQLGTLLLALSIGALIAMPLTGLVIVRVGSRKLTAIMLVTFILGAPLLALLPGFVSLLCFAVLLGMSMGSLDISMNAQAILVEDGLKRPAMSSFHAIFSAGMLLGAGVASGFISAGFGLFPHLLFASFLCLIVAYWSVRQLLDEAPADPLTDDNDGAPQQKGFRYHPTILLLGITAFCCMIGEGAMADWTPIYMLRIVGSPEQIAPLGQAAFSGAMMLGRLGGDRARAAYGGRLLIRAGSIMALCGLGIALFYPTLVTSLLGFLLVGLGLSNVVPIAYSVSGRIPGIPSGVGISSVTTIGYAGFLFGPPIIGFISDWHNEAMERGINPTEWWLDGSWRGLQFGLGFIWLLFILLLIMAFFFLRIKELPRQ